MDSPSDSPQTNVPPGQNAADVFVFPMSFAQQRLWFIDRLQPKAWAYNMPTAFRLEGDIDAGAIQKSLTEIVRRHEVLRTTFDLIDGVPSQLIGTFKSVDWDIVDLTNIPEADRERAARDYIHEQSHLPFDLARGPVFNARLIRLGDREHILLTNKHHIVSDAWSEDLFVEELAVLYNSFAAGKSVSLPELEIQYADYADWQRKALQSSAVREQLAYWKKKLSAPLPVLQLPAQHSRPAIQTTRGETAPILIPPELVESLKRIGRSNGVTLFMTLLAAFKVLLVRYSGQEDIVIGSPIANRSRSETEHLIGFFLNMLVLRTDLSGDPPFREALARVRETALGGYEHPDIPFEMLVDELHPERDLSQNPLCQVMFVLQNEPSVIRNIGGIKVTALQIESTTAKFDLTLSLMEKGDGVTGNFIYNADLFDGADIERMAAHFLLLLEGIANDPETPLSRLSLFGRREQELLAEWNRTERPFPENKSVHGIFEAQAARTPGAVALADGGKTVTYSQLNREANSLAAHLRQLGVEAGMPVAVCLERSPRMIMAFLAILKAGGAYVPLDPAYPRERISWMISDSGASLVLSEGSILYSLLDGGTSWRASNGSGPRFLDLETEWPAIKKLPAIDVESQIAGSDPAYIIYTSGSTGTPKGVAVPHRAINRLVLNTNYIRLEPGDVVGQISNCCFDAATFEIWGALLNGSTLTGVPKETFLSPRRFAGHINEHGINTIFLTTALFNHLVREAPEIFPKLKHLLFGGEAVDVRSVAACVEQGPPLHLLHVYGPTEATTFATFHEVRKLPCDARTVPIGKPIANTTAYILDGAGRPVPVGMNGELHIGGPGLAIGYWRREELTSERFIHHVLPDGRCERLYRTGDIARFLPDGSLEFVGRADHQVKIRGFRIEPGEVEMVLSRHAEVAQNIVLAREDERGDKRLVAYVVAAKGADLNIPALQEFLRGQLPEYMLPSAFVLLPRLPLNANGKVDRSALPMPNERSGESPAFVAPRDEIEAQLVEIWEQALHRRPIGVRDDFFDIGGHSLLAVGLFAQIERKLGKNLPLASLFQAPTVAQLADIVRQQHEENHWASLVPIQPLGNVPPFFCVHGGDGGILFYSELGRQLSPDQPLYGIQAQGLDGRRIEHTSAEEMAACYLRELRQLQPAGPYCLGGYSFGGIVALEMAQQFLAAGEEVAFLGLFDTNNPAVPARRYTFSERVSLRIRDMSRLNTRDKVSYLFNRATGKAMVMWNLERENFKKFLHKRTMSEEPVIPTELRSLHVRETSMGAFDSYRPKPYPRLLTVFRAENPNDGFDYDSHLGWREVATAGLEIIDVPGAHETIFAEPNVQVLAARIRDCLARARSAASNKGVALPG